MMFLFLKIFEFCLLFLQTFNRCDLVQIKLIFNKNIYISIFFMSFKMVGPSPTLSRGNKKLLEPVSRNQYCQNAQTSLKKSEKVNYFSIFSTFV